MKKLLVILLLAIAAVPLALAVAGLPPHGSPTSPAYTHVSAHYLEHGAEEAGAENIVTSMILNYRGFDTDGEVTVIFTSLAAVLGVLLLTRREGAVVECEPEVPVSPVVHFIVRVLSPFIAIFAIYVILNGHISPGGGFQGGTVLGALFIATAIVMGRKKAAALMPAGLKPWLQAAGPLTFASVGIVGLLLTGYYLGYPTASGAVWIRTLMLLIVEIGIGVGGAFVLASIYEALEAE